MGFFAPSIPFERGRVFSATLDLSASCTYAQHSIVAPITFAVGPNPLDGVALTLSLVANGVNANVPVFPDNLFSRLNSSGSWVNTAGAVNIVEIQRINGANYFTISQPIPAAATPVIIDPNVETFISMPRRTADISLVGNTYSGIATSSLFTSHAQSDIKMVGDGYVRLEPGVVGSGRPIWGLSSTANTLNAYTSWLYSVARYEDRASFACFYNGANQASYLVPVTAEMRMIRTAGSVAIQHKIPAASTWTTLHTYTAQQNFSGNLWFNMSVNIAQNSMNATVVNPRMLGAS